MLQIDSTNQIMIDGAATGLRLTQRGDGTVIYTPQSGISGQAYREHSMPHRRYSAAHDAPASGAAGASQLEADVRALLARLAQE